MGSFYWIGVFMIFLSISHVKCFNPMLQDNALGHDEITLRALNELQFCSLSDDFMVKIRKANRDVDLSTADASDHCDNEQLYGCSSKAVTLINNIVYDVNEIDRSFETLNQKIAESESCQEIAKSNALKKLKERILKNYRVLANHLGSALHIVQDFYAHSNFIDREMAGKRDQLQIFDSVFHSIDQQERPCPKTSNILDPKVNGYTSGYRNESAIPPGKCAHGIDNLGIHKDTASKVGHTRAVQRATEASVLYLKHILNLLSSERKRSLLRGCVPLPSLQNMETFGAAIDVSGSMGTTIEEVKAWISKFILSGQVTYCKYIMVLFNDPEVGDPQIYVDSREFLSAVQQIRVDGGGDCPEMMYTGIEKLARSIDMASSLFVFSDADAKDLQEKRDIVRSLVKEKQLKMNYVLTGQCNLGIRKRRSISTSKSPTRIDAEELAASSGGVVVDSKPEQVSVSLEIARRMQSQEIRVIKEGRIPDVCTNITFSIIQEGCNVSVVLRPSSSTPALIFNPKGDQVEPTTYLQTENTILLSLENVISRGEWKMRFCRNSHYQISSNENIKVTAEILEQASGPFGKILLPLEGPPLADQMYQFRLHLEAPDVSHDFINNTIRLFLMSTEGDPLNSDKLVYKLSSATTSKGTQKVTGHLQIPTSAFQLVVSIETRDGLTLERYSNIITPSTIRIIPHHYFVDTPRNTSSGSDSLELHFTITSSLSTPSTVELNTGVSKDNSYIQSVRLLNASTLTIPGNSSVNVSVAVVPRKMTFCAEVNVDARDYSEIYLSIPSPMTSNIVQVKTSCISNVTIPRGCVYSETVGRCQLNGLQAFEITIIEVAEAGGIPCPEKLSGTRPCDPNLSSSIYQLQVATLLFTLLSLFATWNAFIEWLF